MSWIFVGGMASAGRENGSVRADGSMARARGLNLRRWIDEEVGFKFAGIDGRGGAGRGGSGKGGSHGSDQRRQMDLWQVRGV